MFRRHRQILPWLAFCAMISSTILNAHGCAKAPPNLTPQANAAFHKTHVIKGLDLLRDTAVDLEAQIPQLISFDQRQRVVQFHESALKVMNVTDQGWVPIVQTSLAELMKNLPPGPNQLLSPYAALVSTLLSEVPR